MTPVLTEAGRRAFRILLTLDQSLFVLLTLGAAWPDEAPSAAAWRLERSGSWHGRFWRPVIDALFAHLPLGLAEQDHCRKAFESELQGRHLPPEYRQHQS